MALTNCFINGHVPKSRILRLEEKSSKVSGKISSFLRRTREKGSLSSLGPFVTYCDACNC